MYELYEVMRPVVSHILRFLFGEMHQGIAAACALTLMNAFAGAVYARRQSREETQTRRLRPRPRHNLMERFFAYALFVSLGNMLDLLMMNELIGFEGSSQLLACLDIVRREGKGILRKLEKNYGITMPVIADRLNALDAMSGVEPTPEESLDRQLRELQEEIAALRAGRPPVTEENQEE